jgi:hypothetical protein
LKINAFIEKRLTEWKGRNIGEAWGRGLASTQMTKYFTFSNRTKI